MMPGKLGHTDLCHTDGIWHDFGGGGKFCHAMQDYQFLFVQVWDQLAVDLKSSGDGLAQWQGNNLLTAKGKVTCPGVKNAPIK